MLSQMMSLSATHIPKASKIAHSMAGSIGAVEALAIRASLKASQVQLETAGENIMTKEAMCTELCS